MKITFEARPIETAPKDREIAGFCGDCWLPLKWSDLLKLFVTQRGISGVVRPQPTLWTELDDMLPGSQPVPDTAALQEKVRVEWPSWLDRAFDEIWGDNAVFGTRGKLKQWFEDHRAEILGGRVK